jgi:hypothetical protein
MFPRASASLHRGLQAQGSRSIRENQIFKKKVKLKLGLGIVWEL